MRNFHLTMTRPGGVKKKKKIPACPSAKLQPRFTYPKPFRTSPNFYSSLSSGQMDSHCILACMNIFSVHLLLLEFFSRLTLLHDFFSSLCIDNTFTRIYILCLFSISRSRKYQYFLVKFLNKKSLHSALMFSR